MYFCFKNDAHAAHHIAPASLPLGDASSAGRFSSGSRFSHNAFAFLFPISAAAATHSGRSTFAVVLCTSLMLSYAERAPTAPTPSC